MKAVQLLLLLAVCAHAQDTFTLLEKPAKIGSAAITEASGLAVSPSSDGFLWIVNDSGGTPEIHLCNTDGTPRGSVTVKGVKNTDWEDLAAFTYKGENFLLISDTGDNDSKRDSVFLLIVREPALPTAGKSVAGEVPVAWKIESTFEDGPRDCEAVAVDARKEKIILVSKRTEPPLVYELPLQPAEKEQVAKRIGTTQTIAPAFILLPHRNQPTEMDISPDGSTAAIVSYYGVFLFPKENGQTWGEAFAAQSVRIGSHKLPQAESVAFAKDGKSLRCISEGRNSSIVTFGSQK